MAKIETSRCNLTALRKATRRVSQLYDQILAASGLRGTQRAILVYVKRSGSPTMGELAAALVLDRTALNHNLKPLERDGLLTITVDKNDRRSRLVRLTKRGEVRLDESQAAWLEAQERFETAFGARQAADLRQTLELVAALDFGERAADLPAP
ncbi:MarR family winged helix-turn-helix transcriptional regulator [Bradyrhizobium tropiciagri]|uniref:MarR family winged helix-turn-helix transcriptional regulator n=1 Tax=Bradyrhizobium tropiciagri TaxID=312253 RepID=UPI00067E1824|nr:MarR family transcriptional regulator [Bradyrhizobium tropiciagri]